MPDEWNEFYQDAAAEEVGQAGRPAGGVHARRRIAGISRAKALAMPPTREYCAKGHRRAERRESSYWDEAFGS